MLVFDKPALSRDQQIELIRERGLDLGSEVAARHLLQFVGYFRLSAYFHALYDVEHDGEGHKFRKGATFDQVVEMFDFDRRLRLMLFDAIEKVEVGFKACLSNVLSDSNGAFWFEDSDRFVSADKFLEWSCRFRAELGRNANGKEVRHDVYIRHYYDRYSKPLFPPSWMILEAVSFGFSVQTFSWLQPKLKKEIAKYFDLSFNDLESWILSVSYLRNLCAHHMRIWNRNFTLKPRKKKGYGEILSPNDGLFAQVYVLNYLSSKAAPETEWAVRFIEFVKTSSIGHRRLRFPTEWDRLLLEAGMKNKD